MIVMMNPPDRREWMRAPDRMAWRGVFAGEHDQIGEARRMVEALFAGTGREDDAGLIVSELSTNAILHTRSGSAGGWFGVEVRLPEDGPAYLGVSDLGGAGRPLLERQRAEGQLAVGGFGLMIVRDLAVKLSQVGSPAIGHTVWVHLDLKAKDEHVGVAAE
ncbi:ATP-binding protein [Nonomuraea antri]|uniref:ATP-binding protein n=1 Tax=Nonomuraea antri TaxID=2730852 RepID=UPI001C2B953A|nr:ATP-binding protein [Nonomuraea antri]